MLAAYPSLSDAEFSEACKTLEQRCHDNLTGTHWLSIDWHDNELDIKQTRPVIKIRVGEGNSNTAEADSDKEIVDNDDTDTVVRHQTDGQLQTTVDFSILLSPTYRVPVLWFTLSSTKAARIQDLEDAYSRVVAPGAHEALRGIGIMGGISLANHPRTDKPTFFVHPCNTAEALAALNDGSGLSPFEYLLLWFGVVGSGVGLHVPSQLVS